MKQTIKIAELATFIYAFLFLGALCINMSYYAVFSINIVAYVEMSEIMLMFLTSPVLYSPVLFMICYFICQPSIVIDDISTHMPQISVIKRKFQKLNTMIIFIFFSLLFSFIIVLDIKISESILFMLIMLIFVLPCWTIIFDNMITHAMKNIWRIGTEDFSRLWKQASNNVKGALFKDHEDIPSKLKLITYIMTSGGGTNDLKISRISYRKRMVKNYRLLYKYKSLYIIGILYIFIIIGASIINVSRALLYVSKEKSPNKVIELCFNDMYINTKDSNNIFVGECNKYVFIYDTKQQLTHIIPRDRIDSINIFLNEDIKMLF